MKFNWVLINLYFKCTFSKMSDVWGRGSKFGVCPGSVQNRFQRRCWTARWMFSNIMRRSGAACNFPALCGNVAGSGECLEDKASSVHRSVWRSRTDPAAPSGTPGLRGFPPRAAGVQNWFHMWALDRTGPPRDDNQRVQKSLIQAVDQFIDQLLGGQKTPSLLLLLIQPHTNSFIHWPP